MFIDEIDDNKEPEAWTRVKESGGPELVVRGSNLGSEGSDGVRIRENREKPEKTEKKTKFTQKIGNRADKKVGNRPN